MDKAKISLINDFNIEESVEYKSLDKELTKWSERFYVIKPKLKIRFNRTNEAHYLPNIITILVTKESFFNNKDIPYLKVAMAHEFGHHVANSKNIEIQNEIQSEQYADLIALKLVGYYSIEKVFLKEEELRPRFSPIEELLIPYRLEFLREQPLER